MAPSQVLVCCVFFNLKVVSNFLCDFFYDPLVIQEGVDVHIFVNFPNYLLLWIANFIPVWSENRVCMILTFLVYSGTSLVVQWVRVCLVVQRIQV